MRYRTAGRYQLITRYSRPLPGDSKTVKAAKQAATTTAQKYINIKNATERLQLLLCANFDSKEACFCTYTFTDEALPANRKHAKAIFAGYLRSLRKAWKQSARPFKYIYTIEGEPLTSENPQTITVKTGETAQVSFTNAMRFGSITIEKVDSRGEPLAGAKFLLEWSEDGSLWWPIEYSETLGEGKCSNPNIEDGCLTSSKDGLLEWPDLHPGLYYRVTELEAPEGYTLLSEPAFEGKLPNEELTISLRVVNCETFTLPQTGVSTAAIFRISQLLCIIVCASLFIFLQRRQG